MANKQNYWKGKKFSKEHKQKIREANIGKKKSDAIKAKIRKSMKGNKNGISSAEKKRVINLINLFEKAIIKIYGRKSFKL